MDWYADEILDGLTKLMSLGLDRTPAADLVQITAATWIDATTSGHEWDQRRDTPRIRAAFSTLQRTRESWPAPRHFLDAMPRIEQRAIGYEVKPLTKEQADERVAEIKRLLAEPRSEDPRPLRGPQFQTTPEQRNAAERELMDRKTAAAGGDA
jgi:hypothetical protein